MDQRSSREFFQLSCGDEGRSTAELMQAIYGVDLPAEAYALDRALAAGLDLPLVVTVHPWRPRTRSTAVT